MIKKIAAAAAMVAALSATQVGAQAYGAPEQSAEEVSSGEERLQRNEDEAEQQARQSQQQREEQERQLEIQADAQQSQLEKDQQQTNAIMSGNDD